ncbi:hypothetical protein RF11_14111 [Thelohanellus kitauei]|uniref:Uncharacterized protein n=1 Tax=Thelohanellus kitauei TaxID=669202 RepID=A0A0C2M3T6_THEKT|nr:hypothetical protein RF11_14111 [Thelohanellus kitauei]
MPDPSSQARRNWQKFLFSIVGLQLTLIFIISIYIFHKTENTCTVTEDSGTTPLQDSVSESRESYIILFLVCLGSIMAKTFFYTLKWNEGTELRKKTFIFLLILQGFKCNNIVSVNLGVLVCGIKFLHNYFSTYDFNS